MAFTPTENEKANPLSLWFSLGLMCPAQENAPRAALAASPGPRPFALRCTASLAQAPVATALPSVSPLDFAAPDYLILPLWLDRPAGEDRWLAVILVHGGGFRTGHPFESPAAGQTEPPGLLVRAERTTSLGSSQPVGDAPGEKQIHDIKALVRAARADQRRQDVVGGSSGGFLPIEWPRGGTIAGLDRRGADGPPALMMTPTKDPADERPSKP